ncbi:MAG: tRNA (N(6)-L-threonylcarbamoyladenosine(37)-C(2))-methylthiotransferase MtaB [Firmicutes bacterium]|nr:tRNA (N(6)-L-threonylcarbamoyladenosine(37)-C(2))-methylthiotransferase MtaB [Bacillota bacterium]
MKIAFHTLGCKVNQYETEAMKEQFRSSGNEIVGEEDWADVYIINTCTVTNLADRKSRQYIRRMKKQNPQAIVAVTGCYAQVRPEELTAMEEVDIVTGTGEKNNLLSYVEQFRQQREAQLHIRTYDELTEYTDRGIITSMESRTRAYIKIQEGCNRFCSYCLIPFARGHVRSRNPEEIVMEASVLIGQGFKELILTGINTALYGTEESFHWPLTDAEQADGVSGIEIIISRINALEGDFRIRLSSLEPTVVNADYVKRLMKYERLCPHLHLSIQSGSDNVLKLMNRRYNRNEYLDIVRVLKEHDPGYGITTDIIAGFPGETEEDFADSIDMIERVQFCKVHGFRFSARPGTAAAGMKNQIDGNTKNHRIDRLLAAGEESARKYFAGCAKRREIRTVLFEEWDGQFITGYTENYIKVYAEGGEGNLNSFQKVRLLEEYKDGMKGEIING